MSNLSTVKDILMEILRKSCTRSFQYAAGKLIIRVFKNIQRFLYPGKLLMNIPKRIVK
jgi:hypothetical protein